MTDTELIAWRTQCAAAGDFERCAIATLALEGAIDTRIPGYDRLVAALPPQFGRLPRDQPPRGERNRP